MQQFRGRRRGMEKMGCQFATDLVTGLMKRSAVLFLRISLVTSVLSCNGHLQGQDLGDMLTNWDPDWPKRFGVTAVGYSQEQNYALDNFTFAAVNAAGEALPLPVDDPGLILSGIENEVSQWGAKADFWILPFWNVHGMVGQVDGQTGVDLNPAGEALTGIDRIEVDYDGTVFAAGSTLAYGQDWWFISVTGIYAYTNVKGDIDSIPSWMIMPKIGGRWNKLEMWAGATYQNVSERQSGVFDLPGLIVNYDLELEAEEAWNTQVGVRYSLTDSLFLTLEAGFGRRESLTGNLEWRF